MRFIKFLFIFFALFLSLACGNNSNGGKIKFSASGEVLAYAGYDFPPTSGATGFVDGWQIEFSELLVTLDHLTLSENPDKNPNDQSQTDSIVAQLDGPWVIDLHPKGTLAGAGGGDETAIPFAELDKQNKNGNKPFDPTQRYAFGFDIVTANMQAKNVNLSASQLSNDYQYMISQGYTVYYVGTATWKGDDPANKNGCITQDKGVYNFGQNIPRQINFKLGFKSPTTYINCQNGNADAAGFPGEEHQRGIAIKSNTTSIAQVTIHTDHPFWQSVLHDSPAHFDMLGAHADQNGAVTLEALKGVSYTHVTDVLGRDLPWRGCLSGWSFPDGGAIMHFDDQGISGFADLYDFLTYNQSTQGHLNSDGLCFVKHNYPSSDYNPHTGSFGG